MDKVYPPFFFGATVGFVIAMTFSDITWKNTIKSYKQMTDICLKIHNKVPTDEDYPSHLQQCKEASKVITGNKNES